MRLSDGCWGDSGVWDIAVASGVPQSRRMSVNRICYCTTKAGSTDRWQLFGHVIVTVAAHQTGSHYESETWASLRRSLSNLRLLSRPGSRKSTSVYIYLSIVYGALRAASVWFSKCLDRPQHEY